MFKDLTITSCDQGVSYSGVFAAMASDCEILVETEDKLLATELIQAAYREAKRVENKFSRYLEGNIIDQINNSHGQPITVDNETAQLIAFSYTCFELSDGLFDITSGVLRRAWQFDGSDNIPSVNNVLSLLKMIGLQKITWSSPELTVPKGMEIDLGGIGKEYAVDSCLNKILEITANVPVLLNFGGDLICNGPRKNGEAWTVGVESIGGGASAIIALKQGALATSGDANRFLFKAGIRYSHILNPLTGYPIEHAMRSITVAAESCIEAGLLSTIAMLQGQQAAVFLQQQQVKHWIQT